MQIQGNTFLVSGGSSGLGAACVRMLAAAGGNVVVADLNQESGERLTSEGGDRIRFLRVNVTEEAEVAQAVETVVATFGGLHGAIICAGVVHSQRLLGKKGPHDFAAFTKVINTNVIGSFLVLRQAAAAMSHLTSTSDGERGVVVMTSSVAAFDGQIGQAAYSASKGAVASMTLPVARELAQFGIRVVSIAPGIFDTPLLASLSEEARRSLGQQVPFPPRLGHPDEFAALVRHVIENQMLNGAVLRLDGALRMAAK